MLTEYKPCPFCGHNNVDINKNQLWTGKGMVTLSVAVTHICPSDTFPTVITCKAKTLEEAINKWNNRC